MTVMFFIKNAPTSGGRLVMIESMAACKHPESWGLKEKKSSKDRLRVKRKDLGPMKDTAGDPPSGHGREANGLGRVDPGSSKS